MNATEEVEIPFPDGNVTGATRVGTTVRRRTGPWTPAIHPLLRHLERVGFEAAPRVLDFDGQGREVLNYIEGETSSDPRVSFGTDEALAEVARLLLRYHDATTSFVPVLDAPWHFQAGAPTTGEVICNNDIAPWNTVVHDGQAVAFIDWDFATPGPRIWDVTHALWRFVPLYDGPDSGTVAEQSGRLRLFCDAYGLRDLAELLPTISRRQRALHDSMKAWAEAGEPAFAAMWRDGHGDIIMRDNDYLIRNWDAFAREINVIA
jgi:hypothetical protein